MGRRRVHLKAATMLLGVLLIVAGCAKRAEVQTLAPGMKGPGVNLFVLWLYYGGSWMWGPIPMSPGWASMAVFYDKETCMTALNAATEYRRMLGGYKVTASKKGSCLKPDQTPYGGPALEEIFDRYEETILYGE
jgi:hypothetical protein